MWFFLRLLLLLLLSVYLVFSLNTKDVVFFFFLFGGYPILFQTSDNNNKKKAENCLAIVAPKRLSIGLVVRQIIHFYYSQRYRPLFSRQMIASLFTVWQARKSIDIFRLVIPVQVGQIRLSSKDENASTRFDYFEKHEPS